MNKLSEIMYDTTWKLVGKEVGFVSIRSNPHPHLLNSLDCFFILIYSLLCKAFVEYSFGSHTDPEEGTGSLQKKKSCPFIDHFQTIKG